MWHNTWVKMDPFWDPILDLPSQTCVIMRHFPKGPSQKVVQHVSPMWVNHPNHPKHVILGGVDGRVDHPCTPVVTSLFHHRVIMVLRGTQYLMIT
jgi:hypothetical protein